MDIMTIPEGFLALRELMIKPQFICIKKHIDDSAVNSYGTVAAVNKLVYRAKIFNPVKAVVDRIKAVIFAELREDLIRNAIEFFLGFFISHNSYYGVEIIH